MVLLSSGLRIRDQAVLSCLALSETVSSAEPPGTTEPSLRLGNGDSTFPVTKLVFSQVNLAHPGRLWHKNRKVNESIKTCIHDMPDSNHGFQESPAINTNLKRSLKQRPALCDMSVDLLQTLQINLGSHSLLAADTGFWAGIPPNFRCHQFSTCAGPTI